MINETLQEFKKLHDLSQFADVYYCVDKFSNNRYKWHTDYIDLIDDVSDDAIVIDYEIMNIDDLNKTFYANTGINANDIYYSDEEVIFIKLEKEA